MAKKQYQAGDLDRVGSWHQKTEAINSEGQVLFTSAYPTKVVPCHKRDLTGVEGDTTTGDITGHQVVATTRTEFVMRYEPGIKPKDEFECEGVRYNIISVLEGEGRKQWTILIATRKDS